MCELVEKKDQERKAAERSRHNAPPTEEQEETRSLLFTLARHAFLRAEPFSLTPEAIATLSNEDLDKIIFNADHGKFLLLAKLFLIWVAQNIEPHLSEDAGPTYDDLTEYRDHLIFWANRQYYLQDLEPPRLDIMNYKMTEVLRYQCSKQQSPVDSWQTTKSSKELANNKVQ